MAANGTNGNSKKRNADVMSLFSEKDQKNTIKLKPPGARKKPRVAPGNWKERAEELIMLDGAQAKQSQQNGGGDSPGPVVTQLDEKDVATFATGRPLHDELDHIICKHCKKPVIKSVAVAHVKGCLRLKSEKAKERKKAKEAAAAAAAGKGGENGEGDKGGKGSAGKEAGREEGSVDVEKGRSVGREKEEMKKKGAKKMTGAKKTKNVDAEAGTKKKTKKEKAAEGEGKEPKQPKQKKKKEKPAKPEPKPKAPVDVEKQCGVLLANGALCARSLTCKSHSMGAKRAVLGRSQPYDVLLAAYQRKNQAKQQKAAINAGAPHPEEGDGNAAPVDSDEETELVMAGVALAKPKPFATHFMPPVRRRYQYVRIKEMLTGALKPPPSGLFGGMSDHLSNPHGALGDISGVMQDIKMGNHGQFGENLEASSSNIPASIDPPAMRSFHHTMGGSSATAHQRPQAAAHG